MSAKAIENREGVAADPLLQEFQLDEEEKPSQSSNVVEASAGSPGGPPQGPDGSDSDSGSDPDSDSDPTDPPKDKGRKFSSTAAKVAAGAVIGGVVAVAAVPVVLGAMGFTGAGIVASSIAAKMMSAAAIANGGGVAAGSLVATLQSVGAAGLSMSSNVLLASAGSTIGGLAAKFIKVPFHQGSQADEDQPEENVPKSDPEPKAPLRLEKPEK
ncbi:LOW QUALITY PROTEIN: interferon alpha-inducible protein 27-like protein 2 [Equus quagga]|uniref:LOW QUALITY PROTEIN: interferon alpha-inducible protein 27-like protein 2 n=1 Tax=Equus quagga TaxID=89248 RepID=UPI001EE2A445|nr:LOW QUALITY PROTEIN: interferon alpha-inducible protein 27-like protein 2 [Equus quagga]